jgi:deoxyribonuclease V
MVISQLLEENLSERQAKKLQRDFRSILEKIKESHDYLIDINSLNFIMGLDISYYGKNQNKGIACGVLWNFKQNKYANHYLKIGDIQFPYIPGLLGFRESNLLAKVILSSHVNPDLILCDGHGLIHPRRFGEATQLGFALNIPSIGIAKSPFIGYSNWNKLKRERGNKTEVWEKNPNDLKKKNNKILGYAICLSKNKKPVFVSPGYKTDLKLVLEVSLLTTKSHKQPEPLHLADKISRSKRDKVKSKV